MPERWQTGRNPLTKPDRGFSPTSFVWHPEKKCWQKNTDVLSGKDYTITWKTIITNRFDSAAFRLTHADLFAQFSRSSTSRRFVIA